MAYIDEHDLEDARFWGGVRAVGTIFKWCALLFLGWSLIQGAYKAGLEDGRKQVEQSTITQGVE